MTDDIELQGEETAPVTKRNARQLVWFFIPPLLLVGGIGVWLLWPTSDDIPIPSEVRDLPVIDPFQTTPYDEQRSRLQDALYRITYRSVRRDFC